LRCRGLKSFYHLDYEEDARTNPGEPRVPGDDVVGKEKRKDVADQPCPTVGEMVWGDEMV
jgi:hypothetical protein